MIIFSDFQVINYAKIDICENARFYPYFSLKKLQKPLYFIRSYIFLGFLLKFCRFRCIILFV